MGIETYREQIRTWLVAPARVGRSVSLDVGLVGKGRGFVSGFHGVVTMRVLAPLRLPTVKSRANTPFDQLPAGRP